METLKPLELPLTGVHLIEASAGTGKTYTISNLYLRLLLEQELSVDQILVVTFTNAATEELRGRIRQRICDVLRLVEGVPCRDDFLLSLVKRLDDRSQAVELLSDALINMDQASVFTIHTFCQRMLKENAFESGAWFETELITRDSELLLAVIEDFWRREFYPASAGLAKLVYSNWAKPINLLATIGEFLARIQLRIVPTIAAEEVSELRYRLLMEEITALWTRQQAQIQDLLYQDKGLARKKDGYKTESLDKIISIWNDFLQIGIQDYDLPDGFKLLTRTHLAGSIKDSVRKKGGQAPQHRFFDLCQDLQDFCDNKIKQIQIKAIDYCRDELNRRKRNKRVLAFDDLVLNLNQALCSEVGKGLAQKIRQQFPVALIDEFQDTDLAQYQIFQRIYQGRKNNGLFMIGDPKQAIYSFRGGDVFTYMQASRELGASAIYSLDRNWRSSSKLVKAVNLLFGRAKAPFIFEGEIDFHSVKTAIKADQTPLVVDGEQAVAMQIWFVEKTTENQHHKKIKKAWAHAAIAEACAHNISNLINGQNFIGEQRVKAKDIAVLVRDRNEAGIVQQSLLSAGIASAFISRDSVIETEEAAQLHRILLAVANPGNESLVRAALATELVGVSGNELDQLLDDETAWENWLQQFRNFHLLWRRRSFMVMFQALIHQLGIPEKIMALYDGERRVTNLLQLAELLQIASTEQSTMDMLLHWFQELRLNPDQNNEDQQLRLESDEDLVKVVTVHKSKGLEYPIVFLPFIWGSKKRKINPPFIFHQESDRSVCLELGSSEQGRHGELMLREQLAEDLRLLYVALTRAKYMCCFAWGNINSTAESALSYLLCRNDGMQEPLKEVPAAMNSLTDDEFREKLEALSAIAPDSISVTPLPLIDRLNDVDVQELKDRNEGREQMEVRRFKGAIKTDWKMTSYSSLVLGAEASVSFPDYDAVDDEADEKIAHVASRDTSIFKFPRGAGAGIFFHELMEALDFPVATGEVLSNAVASLLRKHGFQQERWQTTVETLVTNVLDSSLDKHNGLSLRKIEDSQKLAELKFYFPVETLTAAHLNEILEKYYRFSPTTPVLAFDQIRGMMQGFIDLVFEYGGRYFVLDYKSNYLGDDLNNYQKDKLWPAMLVHRYDLQYLIYSIALHRYLRNRLPQYDYNQHFGGVYYLFIRGMDVSQGPDSGIFFDLPDYRLIDELDTLFSTTIAQ